MANKSEVTLEDYIRRKNKNKVSVRVILFYFVLNDFLLEHDLAKRCYFAIL